MNMSRFATYVDSVSQIAVREVKTSPDLCSKVYEKLLSECEELEQSCPVELQNDFVLCLYRDAQATLRDAMIRAAMLRQSCIGIKIEVRK